MKKLYLSITLLGMFVLMFLITLVPTQASSYVDPISGLTLDLDVGVPLLGGFTLEEVFFDYNYLNNNGFYDDNNDGLYNNFVLPIQYNSNTNYYIENDTQIFYNPDYTNQFLSSLRTINISNLNDTTKKFYLSYYGENITALVIKAEYARDYDTGAGLLNLPNGRQSYFFKTFGNDPNYPFISFYRNNTQNQLILRNIVLIDVSALGITATKAQLDYYYNLYVLLKAGFSPTIYYDQGYTQGYNVGENDGYSQGFTEGFDDGFGEGYTGGQFDYHTGAYLFDYTQGTSYLEGLETGYNNGVDYAVQENISVLSIFELIFGVALNMITFIITIDIFGISILSIISVLSLMVGAVWILKMVRG